MTQDLYFTIGLVLGIIHFTISILNLEFKFTKSVLFTAFLGSYNCNSNHYLYYNEYIFMISTLSILLSGLIILCWGIFIIPLIIVIISRIIKYYKRLLC